MSVTTKKKEKVKFSKAFWVANTVELLERAAYYGVFVVITLYLSNVLGFTDIQAATIAGCVIPQTVRHKAVGTLVKDNADQRSYHLNHQRHKR